MINYNFTKEDIQFVEKAIELKNKGYYIDGKQLTDVYNKVLNKNVNPTNCGSCIRQRITELEGALNHYKAHEAISSPSDSVEEVKVDSNPQEENKAVKKAKNKK
jgi:hypothetical protein